MSSSSAEIRSVETTRRRPYHDDRGARAYRPTGRWRRTSRGRNTTEIRGRRQRGTLAHDDRAGGRPHHPRGIAPRRRTRPTHGQRRRTGTHRRRWRTVRERDHLARMRQRHIGRYRQPSKHHQNDQARYRADPTQLRHDALPRARKYSVPIFCVYSECPQENDGHTILEPFWAVKRFHSGS